MYSFQEKYEKFVKIHKIDICILYKETYPLYNGGGDELCFNCVRWGVLKTAKDVLVNPRIILENFFNAMLRHLWEDEKKLKEIFHEFMEDLDRNQRLLDCFFSEYCQYCYMNIEKSFHFYGSHEEYMNVIKNIYTRGGMLNNEISKVQKRYYEYFNYILHERYNCEDISYVMYKYEKEFIYEIENIFYQVMELIDRELSDSYGLLNKRLVDFMKILIERREFSFDRSWS